MKKIVVLCAAMLVKCGSLLAQQDAMLSQYMFNGLFVNPAYAGSHKFISSTVTHRNQWTGFSGAPVTSTLAVDGVSEKYHSGWGVLFNHDQIGITTQNDLFVNYAYQLKTSEKGKLALGVKAGVSQYTARFNQLTVWEQNDQVFFNNQSTSWIPRAGFGAYYFTDRMYAGFSAPTLLAYQSNSRFSLNVNESTSLRRHYYLTAGYVFDINPMLKLKPSFLVKYQASAPTEVDINLHALLFDSFWIGASYRTGDAVVGMLEYQVNNRLRLGYGYDYTTSIMNNFSSGTHEFMIGFDFRKENLKAKNPRFF